MNKQTSPQHDPPQPDAAWRLLLILTLLLPLTILFFLPAGGFLHGGFWVWFVMLISFWLIFSMLGAREVAAEEPEARTLSEAEQPETVREVMNVRAATDESGVHVFRGRSRESAATAFEKLKQGLGERAVPMIGQLDGSHAARAMLGNRTGETISSVAMWSLLLLAIVVWPGLMMWALIVFFIAGRGTPPLNDLTPITPGRRWIGYATFLILGLVLLPLPHALWPAAGSHCPYL